MGKTKGGSKEIVAHTTWKNSFKRDYASYPGMRMIFMEYKPAKGYAAASGSAWRRSSRYLRTRIFTGR